MLPALDMDSRWGTRGLQRSDLVHAPSLTQALNEALDLHGNSTLVSMVNFKPTTFPVYRAFSLTTVKALLADSPSGRVLAAKQNIQETIHCGCIYLGAPCHLSDMDDPRW